MGPAFQVLSSHYCNLVIRHPYYMKCLIINLAILISVLHFEALAGPPFNRKVADLLKPKLNSERIEYFFGNYGIDQLDVCKTPFPKGRVSNLYSIHENKKLLRTLAITEFETPVNPSLISAHKKIVAGASIGASLRQAGWKINKEPIYFGKISLTPQIMHLMHTEVSNQAAVHIYRLGVHKTEEDKIVPYCTIIEVHSPEYLGLDGLELIYDAQFQRFNKANESIGFLMKRIQECSNQVGSSPNQ